MRASRAKPLSRHGNGKRNTPIGNHGRRKRGRNPETLHRFRQKRIQPWLDLAAAVGFAEEVPAPWEASPEFVDRFLERHAGLKRVMDSATPFWCATRGVAMLFFPMGAIFDRARDAREFYEFFWNVRCAIDWIADAETNEKIGSDIEAQTLGAGFDAERSWKRMRDLARELIEAKALGRTTGLRIPSRATITKRDGFVHLVEETFLWAVFKAAIEGIEVKRLKRCYIRNCRKIFYATRKNTGACREHLARARVYRGRDRELRRQYEQTRRINRLVRKGKSIGEAKSEVQQKGAERRKVR